MNLIEKFTKKFPKFEIYIINCKLHQLIIKEKFSELKIWMKKQNIRDEIIRDLIIIFDKFYSSNKLCINEKLFYLNNNLNNKLGIIVQARMSSSRLPGKANARNIWRTCYFKKY